MNFSRRIKKNFDHILTFGLKRLKIKTFPNKRIRQSEIQDEKAQKKTLS